jgi:HEAT repeats
MRHVWMAMIVAAATLAAPPAGAQDLPARITAVANGEVRLSFTAREDVCGQGEFNIRTGHHGRSVRSGRDTGDDDWSNDCPCEHGPVRVALEVRDHHVTKVRTRVGGQWRESDRHPVDLGMVPAPAAARALLALAADPANSEGDEAVFPATLADSVQVGPDLLRLARDGDARRDSRRQAIFWAGQIAGDSATAGLQDLAENETEDRDLRTQAVFALSQRPKDEGVPALIRVARTNRDPEVRRSALFWLGQSDDPRALALFEELLVKK